MFSNYGMCPIAKGNIEEGSLSGARFCVLQEDVASSSNGSVISIIKHFLCLSGIVLNTRTWETQHVLCA